MADQFCLKWNNYQLSLTSAFKHLLEEEDFVDVTLSAEGQNLKAHKVVLSACSSYFRELLRGISLWQHPVLVLRDVPFLELQTILEFVYLGEVNVEQDRLQSFLKTAELLRIKGLTDGLQESSEKSGKKNGASPVENKEKSPVVPNDKPVWGGTSVLKTNQLKRPLSSLSDNILENGMPLNNIVLETPEKRVKNTEEINDDRLDDEVLIPQTVSSDMEYDDEDYDDEDLENGYDGEHIIVAGDPVTNEDFENHIEHYNDSENDCGSNKDISEKEFLGPLHKRCPHCQMIMLKKNLSRHIRDQHSSDRPRSNCPICQKSYKTPDWLKDHIRRGHGYTKEATDDLIAKLNLKHDIGNKLKSPAVTPIKAS
eukprot:GFUD01015131.1.p1 GENE.GFUD01015131.1~~GFUD01015131.1.p1  ORF type:complete len:368 (-),score=52.11 GFUD01015131.1:370-1473(-)